MKTKAIFKRFLIGYVSNGCTVDRPSMKELNKLTDEFLDDLIPDYYFDEYSVDDYIQTMKEQLSEENRHFFKLEHKRRDYIKQLEQYIKTLIEHPEKFKNTGFIHVRFHDSDDSDYSDSDTV